jgi:hypothetical protein
MRGTPEIRRLAILALALLVAATALAGCSTPPAHKEIEVVGVLSVVGGSNSGGDVIDSYAFDDGRTYSMHFHGGRQLDAEGGWGNFPDVGDLLIAGSKPGYWLLFASPSDSAEGCPNGSFGIPNLNGYDTETTVELDFGVTLQKSAQFNPVGHPGPGHFRAQSLICLDRQGQVLQLYG